MHAPGGHAVVKIIACTTHVEGLFVVHGWLAPWSHKRKQAQVHTHEVDKWIMETPVRSEPECRVHDPGHLGPRGHNVSVDSILHGQTVVVGQHGVSVFAKLCAELELNQTHDYLLGLQLVVFENIVRRRIQKRGHS